MYCVRKSLNGKKFPDTMFETFEKALEDFRANEKLGFMVALYNMV